MRVELHSSANVNHTFSEHTISKDFTTPQNFGSGEFFLCILLRDNGILRYRKNVRYYCMRKADGLEGKEWRFKQKDFVSIVEKSIQKAVCCVICRRAKREVQSLLEKKGKEDADIFRLLLLGNIKKIIG